MSDPEPEAVPAVGDGVEVVTWYLEMTSPEELKPAAGPLYRLDFREVGPPAPELGWFLYVAVGARWGWTDRLAWDDEAWRAHAARDDASLWIGWLDGAPAGYVEYRLELPGQVQLWYFGLLPGFTGQGLGGELLTRATRRAWAWDPERVWVHTCSLDGPAALPNYQARGFRIYDETRERKAAPGPVEPRYPF